MAKHAAQTAPGLTRVIFENNRVRVIELTVKKGSKAEMHTHPAYFAYSLTPFEYKSTPARGKTEHRRMKAGEIDWEDGESHEVEFVSPGRALVVELK
ncbi:MAG TPA: hypothetical protein VLY82_04500 [Nitrososphaerales archaeon]|nr:hypothetical protein [Nitrososphaerales archaeon]